MKHRKSSKKALLIKKHKNADMGDRVQDLMSLVPALVLSKVLENHGDHFDRSKLPNAEALRHALTNHFPLDLKGLDGLGRKAPSRRCAAAVKKSSKGKGKRA